MATNSNDFKKGVCNFRLIGKVKLSDHTFDMERKSESGFVSNKMYLGVDCGSGNVVYSQLFDGYKLDEKGNITKKIFAHGSKEDPNNPKRRIDDYENKIDILWVDRHSPENKEIIDNLGPSCFTQIGLLKNKDNKLVIYRFISDYDAVAYCKAEFSKMTEEELNNLVVEVRGTIEYRYYEGKVTYQKNITSIKRKDGATEADYRAEFVQTIYADKASLGPIDTEANVLPLAAKVPEYIGKYKDVDIKSTIPLTMNFQINADSSMASWISHQLSQSSGYARLTVIGKFIESGAAQEFNVNSLEDSTKTLLKNGLIRLEDVKFLVTSDSQRTQIMSIQHLRVIKKENGCPDGDYMLSAYKEKEMDSFAEPFFNAVNAIDNGINAVAETATETATETIIETPVEDDFDSVPFDEEMSDTQTDDMDWLKEFQ